MMACELEPLLIGKDDFKCIGQVAEHCDWEQLCTYIREQQNLSLIPKVGQCLWNLVLCYKQHEAEESDSCEIDWDQDTEDRFNNLLCGGTYTGCDGKTRRHFGLQRVMVHYAYGAYVYRHGYIDTPFGVVQKVNQDSVPAPLQELKSIMIENRNAAEQYWQMTRDYLCTLKGFEPFKECMECGDCDCSCGHCKGRGHAMDRGLTFKNVSRW